MADSSDIGVLGVGDRTIQYRYEREKHGGSRVLLGKGSYGCVYSAIDIDKGEFLAIKEVKVQHHGERADKEREELFREMRNLSDLSPHKNIVRYLGCHFTGGTLLIFMEQVTGGTLSKDGRIDSSPVLQNYTWQLLEGLAHLHRNNIMHRDIKGTNILVDRQKCIVKIADFGLSKKIANFAADKNKPKSLVGTPQYIAPEVLRNEPYSTKADIWSLGCTVWEMVVGQPPHQTLKDEAGTTYLLYTVQTGKAPELPEGLSEEGQDFLNKCFTNNPDDRPSAEDLLKHPFVNRSNTGVEPSLMRSLSQQRVLCRSLSSDKPDGKKPVSFYLPSNDSETLKTPEKNTQQDNTKRSSVLSESGRHDDGVWSPEYHRHVTSSATETSMAGLQWQTFVDLPYTGELRHAVTSSSKIHKGLLTDLSEGDLEIINSSALPSKDTLHALPSDRLLQHIIPGLLQKSKKTMLAHIACTHGNQRIKISCLLGLHRLILESSVTSTAEMEALVDVEIILSKVVNRSSFDQPLKVLEALFLCYTTLVCSIYFGLLLSKIQFQSLSSLLSHQKDVLKFLRDIYSGSDHRCKTERQSELLFETMDMFLTKALSSRLVDRWPVLSSSNWTPFRKFHRFQCQKLFQRVIEFCNNVSLSHEDNEEKNTESVLVRDICQMNSRFEKLLLLCYIGQQAQHKPHLVGLLKALVRALWKARLLGHDRKTTAITCHIYVQCLLLASERDHCEKLLDNKDGRMGLLQFLEKLVRPEFEPIIKWACVPLVYHDSFLVRKEITKLVFMAKNDGSIHGEGVHYISNHQKTLMIKLFYVIGLYGLYLDKSIQATQDQKVNIWRGCFGKDRCAVVKVLRPKHIQFDKFQRIGSRKQKDTSGFYNELDAIRALSEEGTHPNIIDMIAYQKSSDLAYYIVETPPMTKNLSEFLMSRREYARKPTLLDLLLVFVLPVIRAVAFCHEKRVLLRNLTTASFLVQDVTGLSEPKLATLDLAVRVKQTDGQLEEFRGTKDDAVPLLWSAPESLLSFVFSAESDCFMLGHTVIEVLSMGCHPYNELYGWGPERKVKEVLLHGIRPERPACIPQSIFTHLACCFTVLPSGRISANQLEEAVTSFLSSQQDAHPPEGEEYVPPYCDRCQPKTPLVGIPKSLWNIQTKEALQNLEEEEAGVHRAEIYDVDDAQEIECKCTEAELHSPDDPKLGPQGLTKHGNKAVEGYVMRMLLPEGLDGDHRSMLESMDHPNLVRVLQVQYSDDQAYLVEEVPGIKTLIDLALAADPAKQDISAVVDLLAQVAKGMEHLHKKHILHCRLRAKFVYIHEKAKDTVQVGNLARSHLLRKGFFDRDVTEVAVEPQMQPGDSGYVRQACRWSPREVNQYGIHSMRSDVASFGLLMWEVLSAWGKGKNKPTKEIAPYATLPADQILHFQARRRPLPQPRLCEDWLYDLIKKCMLDPSHRRPLFPEICDCLESSAPQDHPLVKGCREQRRNTEGMIGLDVFDHDDNHYGDWVVGTTGYRHEKLSKHRGLLLHDQLMQELQKKLKIKPDYKASQSVPAEMEYYDSATSIDAPPTLPPRRHSRIATGIRKMYKYVSRIGYGRKRSNTHREGEKQSTILRPRGKERRNNTLSTRTSLASEDDYWDIDFDQYDMGVKNSISENSLYEPVPLDETRSGIYQNVELDVTGRADIQGSESAQVVIVPEGHEKTPMYENMPIIKENKTNQGQSKGQGQQGEAQGQQDCQWSEHTIEGATGGVSLHEASYVEDIENGVGLYEWPWENMDYTNSIVGRRNTAAKYESMYEDVDTLEDPESKWPDKHKDDKT